MKKILKGKKYVFYIIAEGNGFFIVAQCLFSKRYSFINNLNPILSELGISSDNNKYYDSRWVLTKNEVEKLGRMAKNFLSNVHFRNYIEKKLDEDREYCEWENVRFSQKKILHK